MPTVGERLLTLKARSGLSLAQIASLAGYRGASSIQKLFKAEYDPATLQPAMADRLIAALAGRGDPPIMPDEIAGLVINDGFELLSSELHHFAYLASTEIPILSAKREDAFVETSEGRPITLFTLKREDPTYSYVTPKFLTPRVVVGFHVTVGSMWPRFEEGELIFFEGRSPATSGDDVVLSLIGDDPNEEERKILARLTSLNEDEIILEVFRPQGRIVLSREKVSRIHRVLRLKDLLEGPPRVSTLSVKITDID